MAKQATSFTKFLPPPVKGIDLTKPYVSGTAETALEIAGFICRPEGLIAPWGPTTTNSSVTGLSGGSNGCTIIPTGFAATYFVATSTSLQDQAGVGQGVTNTNGKCFYTSFGVGSGGYTFVCNGTNTPYVYNGSTWSTIGFTGTTLANLIQPWSYRHRLYFADVTKLSVWYGGPDSITGTLTEYNLRSIFRRAGTIAGINSLTLDGGIGPDDILVILSSSGEVALLSGSDPAARDWQVLGVFDVGNPLSSSANNTTTFNSNVMAKLGGDLLILTQNGLVSLKSVLRGQDISAASSLSTGINPLIRYLYDYQQFSNANGCEVYVLRSQGILVVMLEPVRSSSTGFGGYVMDLQTGAWSRWEGQTGSVVSGGYGSYYSFTEIPFSSGMQVWAIDPSNLNLRRCFGVAAGPVTTLNKGNWRIRYPYMRLGMADPFRITAMKPQLLLGDVVPTSFVYTQEVAYDMSGNYIGGDSSAYNGSINDLAVADILYKDFRYSTATGARITRPWKTLPSHNGCNVAYLIRGSFATAAASPGEMRFFGVDLRIEQVENLGP